MLSLADPYLKTARAKEHLADLGDRLRAFRNSKPCTFTRQDDFENGRHILRFHIRDMADKLPLIVGDFLYCLRSSLDQLVWSLARVGGIDYPDGTQFPIFGKPNARKLAEFTVGVPADAVQIIDQLQPYQVRDDATIRSQLLWRLNALCNIDKHRRIPTDVTVVDFNFPDFPREFLPSAVVDHDAEMISVPLHLRGHVALDPEIAVNIVFGDSHEGIKCDFEGLEQMYEFVTNSVIPRFARFFRL
jgi:hypothetical protein